MTADRISFAGVARLISISLLLAAGCDGSSPKPTELPTQSSPDTDVLARVDGAVITTADLERAIVSTPRPAQLEYINPPQRRELLDSLVDRKLMAAQAFADGLDRDPDIAKALDAASTDPFERDRRLAQRYLDTQLGALRVEDAEIDTYYRTHAADFTEAERVQVTRAVMREETDAWLARKRLVEGASAVELKSQMNGRGQISNIWLQRSEDPELMEQAAFVLETGEVSDVIPVRTGFAVLRSDERVAARLRPLADVKAGIAARLDQERRTGTQNELLSQLRKNADISIDEEALAAYQWQE